MNDCKTLSGRMLKDIILIFKKENIEFSVVETFPPHKKRKYGNKRVLAVKELRPDIYKIIWSYE